MTAPSVRSSPPTLAELRRARSEIIEIAARRGAHNIRVFGSVARGESQPGSDVDLLIDVEMGRSLFDLGGLVMDLQELLGCAVDVSEADGLRPRIRADVLAEAVSL